MVDMVASELCGIGVTRYISDGVSYILPVIIPPQVALGIPTMVFSTGRATCISHRHAAQNELPALTFRVGLTVGFPATTRIGIVVIERPLWKAL